MKKDFKAFVRVVLDLQYNQLVLLLKKMNVEIELKGTEDRPMIILKDQHVEYPGRNLSKARGRIKTNALVAAVIDAYVDDVNDAAKRFTEILF